MISTRTPRPGRTLGSILLPGLVLLLLAVPSVPAQDGTTAAGQEGASEQPLLKELRQKVKEGAHSIRNMEKELRRMAEESAGLLADGEAVGAEEAALLEDLHRTRVQLTLERWTQEFQVELVDQLEEAYRALKQAETQATPEDLRRRLDALYREFIRSRLGEMEARGLLAEAFGEKSRAEAERTLTIQEARTARARRELARFLQEQGLEEMAATVGS